MHRPKVWRGMDPMDERRSSPDSIRDGGVQAGDTKGLLTAMLESTQTVAILASTLFAGAALYVSLVEHPARLSCGTELAATEFGPSYKRATVMQVALAVLAAIAGLIRGFLSGDPIWFV